MIPPDPMNKKDSFVLAFLLDLWDTGDMKAIGHPVEQTDNAPIYGQPAIVACCFHPLRGSFFGYHEQ